MPSQRSTTSSTLREQRPEPGHWWIRYRPRLWSSVDAAWTDLASAALGSSGDDRAELAPGLGTVAVDDLIYLPPVPPARQAERHALATALLDAGTPVLLSLAPDEPAVDGRAIAVYDLLRPLLAGDLEACGRLPAGCRAAWPLLAGITDRPELVSAGLARLAAAGVAVVQGSALELEARQRRLLAEHRGEEVFDHLFHAPPPAERDFARRAHAAGIAPFIERPVAATPGVLAANRRGAGTLALLGELWLRLGRSPHQGQAFYRAARWVDRTGRDLGTLQREGNLRLLTWLDASSRAALDELYATGRVGLAAELLEEYLEGPEEGL